MQTASREAAAEKRPRDGEEGAGDGRDGEAEAPSAKRQRTVGRVTADGEVEFDVRLVDRREGL